MKYTSNLNLKKPEYWELADIEDINENMDVLDEAVTSKAPTVHNHTKSQITDFPTSLPANGGNADTVGGKSPSDFTLQSYTDSNIRPVNNVARVNLGSPTVTEMALIDSQATNKIWFHPLDKMIFEESDDGITFNVRSDISDTDKRKLVSGNSNASINIPKGKYFRITIFPRSYVYLNWIYMYLSTAGNKAMFKCEKKRDDGDWITHFNYTNLVSGWPGHIFIPHSTIPFSSQSTSSHYNQVRITIATEEQTNQYPNMTLYGLEWWGGYPRGSRNIFSYDEYQNVTFPEELKAKTYKNASGKEVAYQNDIPTKLSELNKDINFDERYYTKTEVNTKLDEKVDNSRVLTDVPLNAKFTDTVTTINGKTGAISKADIVALGIPAQDTVYTHPANHPASMITESSTKRFVSDAEKTAWNGKQDALGYTPVNKAGDTMTGDLKVNGNVVAGTELIVGYNGTTESLRRHKWKYNGSTGYLELWRYSNQGKWELSATFPNRNTGLGGITVEGKQVATEDYVNSKVKTDVPTGAKFTDTVTTINGKTGAITKADIVALGIPAQDTIYSHPSTHPASMITETTTKRFVSDAEKNTWNTVTSKADLTYVNTELNKKVDKISGKGLSTEDYTSAEKTKLSGIEAGAEVNQNAFSNIKVGTTTIAADSKTDTLELTAGTGITLTPDTTNDKVTVSVASAPKLTTARTISLSGDVSGSTSFNGSANVTITATVADDSHNHIISNIDGLQAALDGKVDNSRVLTDVPANAKFTDTVYTHPSSHPASMITESTSRRFVSDTEKANWNSKAEISDIPTKVSQLENDKNYVTQAELGDAGYGDMTKGVYDTNNNGVVDNAEKLGGQPPNYYQQALGYTPINKSGDTVTGELAVVNDSVRNYLRLKRSTSGANAAEFWFSLGYGRLSIDSSAGQYLCTLSEDGKFGIGVTSSAAPTQKLDVNGKIRMRTQTSSSDGDDIVATKKYVDDGLDSKVNNSRVLTDVPVNAKFTDTIYTHPSSHPASMITESTSRRFVSDSEKATWNGKANLESPTFTGTPKTTANTNYTTAQLRNIRLYSESETIPTLANGEIALIYSTAVMP